MEQTDLFNFRMPSNLKQRFQQTCQNRNTAMTSVLNEFIHDYVTKSEKIETDTWEPIMLRGDESDENRWMK
ncbi:hypothetical protein [Tateyamaria pelophila]|uniref:hypothetical protein n=1 Tax=Tateyamaria pelophila TaxID=328415 RepID=UPI001CBAD16E|nr:hypothetical protein [Tateyamaria pelophila]